MKLSNGIGKREFRKSFFEYIKFFQTKNNFFSKIKRESDKKKQRWTNRILSVVEANRRQEIVLGDSHLVFDTNMQIASIRNS